MIGVTHASYLGGLPVLEPYRRLPSGCRCTWSGIASSDVVRGNLDIGILDDLSSLLRTRAAENDDKKKTCVL